ncbi:MAG: hypothetical protein RIS20_1934 [Bacteroidota bacterium]|jgi:hypothetical protein
MSFHLNTQQFSNNFAKVRPIINTEKLTYKQKYARMLFILFNNIQEK